MNVARNIGSWDTLKKSFQSAWRPLQKEEFASVVQRHGLHISHDIVYKPASGLCLGGSLLFLSLFKQKNSVFAAAKAFLWGAPERAVKLQALYDALLEGADPAQKDHDAAHTTITKAVAEMAGFEHIEARRIFGNAREVSQKIAQLTEGSYLIQFVKHTVAFVKLPHCQAVFDLNEGIGIELSHQTDMLAQLLNFYGKRLVYIKLIHLI